MKQMKETIMIVILFLNGFRPLFHFTYKTVSLEEPLPNATKRGHRKSKTMEENRSIPKVMRPPPGLEIEASFLRTTFFHAPLNTKQSIQIQ